MNEQRLAQVLGWFSIGLGAAQLLKIGNREIDPGFSITHRLALDDAPTGYQTLRNKQTSASRWSCTPDRQAQEHRFEGPARNALMPMPRRAVPRRVPRRFEFSWHFAGDRARRPAPLAGASREPAEASDRQFFNAG